VEYWPSDFGAPLVLVCGLVGPDHVVLADGPLDTEGLLGDVGAEISTASSDTAIGWEMVTKDMEVGHYEEIFTTVRLNSWCPTGQRQGRPTRRLRTSPASSGRGRTPSLGRLVDYGMIVPRLQQLYQWSAHELATPGLLDFVRDGAMTYSWSIEDRSVWQSPKSLNLELARRPLPRDLPRRLAVSARCR
jgi:hypothetical protein